MADESKSDEQRATEELLAGFDRPGRSPRAPVMKRDFVAFHGPTSDPLRARETVLVTRSRRPIWLPWALVAFVASAVFGIVAGVAQLKAKPKHVGAPSSPPSALVSVAASPSMSVEAVATVAPAAPPTTIAATAVAPAVSSSAPRAAAPSASAKTREEPRVDFVRNL